MSVINIKPRIDSITYTYRRGPVRKKPQLGDRRVTKKHGPQVRIPEQCMSGPYRGAFVVSNGRQMYEWVSPEEAYRRYPALKDRHAKEDAKNAA
jgi:hypothetical protein